MSDCVFQKSTSTGGAAFARIELRLLRWLRQSGDTSKNAKVMRLVEMAFIYSWWHSYNFDMINPGSKPAKKQLWRFRCDPPVFPSWGRLFKLGQDMEKTFHLLVKLWWASLLNYWKCHWMRVCYDMLVYRHTRFSDTPKSYLNTQESSSVEYRLEVMLFSTRTSALSWPNSNQATSWPSYQHAEWLKAESAILYRIHPFTFDMMVMKVTY